MLGNVPLTDYWEANKTTARLMCEDDSSWFCLRWFRIFPVGNPPFGESIGHVDFDQHRPLQADQSQKVISYVSKHRFLWNYGGVSKKKTSSKAAWNCGMEVDGFPPDFSIHKFSFYIFHVFCRLNPAEIHCANLPSSIPEDGDCWHSSASQWKPQKVAGNSPVVDDFPSYKL